MTVKLRIYLSSLFLAKILCFGVLISVISIYVYPKVTYTYAQDFDDFDEEFEGDEAELDAEFDEAEEDASFADFEESSEPGASDSGDQLSEASIEDELFEEFNEEDELFEEPTVQETVTPEPVAPVEVAPEPVAVIEPETDEPDYDYEKRLHDIYVGFHNEKMPVEQWDALVGERKSESYKIQNGDTLWAISETFFGDGEYWPKIWSENGRISNPHLITRGNSIVFLMGNEDEAPAFTVADNETAYSLENKQVTKATPDIMADNPEDYVPPAAVATPVVNKLPESIPEWVLIEEVVEGKKAFMAAKRKLVYGDQRHTVMSYITEDKQRSFARVAEIETADQLAVYGQYVYVESREALDVDNREIVTVIKNHGAVETVLKEFDADDTHGNQVRVQGRLEIVEKVESKNNSQLYRAMVLDSFNPITVGAEVVKANIKKVAVDLDGPRSQVSAKIIGGGFDNRSKAFMERTEVYLDKGASDGLNVGDILPVKENRELRKDKTILKSVSTPIGWLKVVDTTEEYSTAIVVKAWKEIYSGDTTGAAF